MLNEQVLSTLRSNTLFAAMTEGELAAITARAVLKKLGSGQLLFSEGEPCGGLHIIVAGRVRIFTSSRTGRERVLAIEGPGASVAELPVFDGAPYPASAVTAENSAILFISRNDFRAACLEHPGLALKMLQVVGKRLRRLVGIIEELSFTTLRQRLISWILRETKARGQVTGRSAVIELGVTHQEIASQIGTVRELVSRNMARLQAQGLIESSGSTITIPDLTALETELNSDV